MRTRTGHVVVDGSNIATEGRSMPSLAQLNDAVMAFLAEFPGTTVTVVVDATFGHRIDKSEVKEFDTAIANNELVAPPAGAVGRGDAFVLSIANKANAAILSNDSFQEFHGDYTWLFDDGRLVGGKPVPHVGWVFVDRVPVRGPVSRKAVRESQSDGDSKRSGGRTRRARGGVARTGSKEASQPMPVPQVPPPGKAAARRAAEAGIAPEPAGMSMSRARRSTRGRGESPSAPTEATKTAATPASGESVNDLMAFLDFVEHHPVGTSVNAIVESYSSHGAYVRIGDVRGYVPLRLMADPPPRSAREVMKVDDAITLVVASFSPARRSIDCAMPHMATDLETQDPAVVIEETTTAAAGTVEIAADERPTRKAAAKAVPAKTVPAKKVPAKEAAAKKSAAKKAAAKKAAAKKAAATTTPAGGGRVEEARVDDLPAERPIPARTSTAKTAAKKTAAKKTAAKKTAAKRSAARKTAAKQSATKKAPVKQAPAAEEAATERSATAKKTSPKKAPAKKAPAKKVAAKKAAARGARRGAAGPVGSAGATVQ